MPALEDLIFDRKTITPSQLCETLRRDFPLFSYDAYRYRLEKSDLIVEYEFSVGESIRFHPKLFLRNVGDQSSNLDSGLLDDLVFHVGLAEIPSYWKAICSPLIQINCGYLDTFQKAWWKHLFVHGMGEFFYTNRITFADDAFLNISSTDQLKASIGPLDKVLALRSLVPVGGGRDSAFTLAALSKGNRSFRSMILNPTPAAIRVSARVQDDPPIIVERTIDPVLLELNKRGFLNGHTPFSAYLAFLNALCLVVYDYSEIVIANERSANEPNTIFDGRAVNHQYSKSFAFEERFDSYLSRYLITNARYFSFVRSLYELQIARGFAQLPNMFRDFRSCNKLQREDKWCGNCAKCVSVYITSYPFMREADLIGIFGSDLFERPSTLEFLRALAGKKTHRPLDCICTVDETIVSLWLAISRLKQEQRPLPLALREFENDIQLEESRVRALSFRLLNDKGPDRLPEYFADLLEKAMSKYHD